MKRLISLGILVGSAGLLVYALYARQSEAAAQAARLETARKSLATVLADSLPAPGAPGEVDTLAARIEMLPGLPLVRMRVEAASRLLEVERTAPVGIAQLNLARSEIREAQTEIGRFAERSERLTRTLAEARLKVREVEADLEEEVGEMREEGAPGGVSAELLVSLLGLLAGLTSTAFAWRQDVREKIRWKLEVEKLRLELEQLRG